MPVYRCDVKIYGTAYCKAKNPRHARTIFNRFRDVGMEVQGNLISGLQYSDPKLPELSLSPAMTIHCPLDNIEKAD